MPLFKIDDLQLWTGGKWSNLPKKYPDIRGFSTDSRKMGENCAFVAIEAGRDGHDFAADAEKNGAVAVIASKPVETSLPVLTVPDTLRALQTIAKFHRLRFEFPVAGITGSCGKTTTKEFLSRLMAWKKPLSTEENFNNELGVALTLTKIDLRENMCAIVEAGVGAPGQMEPLASMIEPDIAIITNVLPAHMERFGEMAAVAREKAGLARGLAKDGWAVFHNNLLSWKAFEELQCKKAVVAPADAPDIRGDLVFRYSLNSEGPTTRIEMCVEGGSEYCFEMPTLTKGMMENAALCIAAALIMGTSEEQLAARLEGIAPGPMRGSVVESDKAKFYVDCYNASPASMKDALRRFLSLSEGSPRLFVLGSMAELGLSSHRHHREIGEMIPRAEGDRAVLVGANSETYKAAMLACGWQEGEILEAQSAEEAAGAVGEFEGWVFLKGSRVCGLERSLPQEVLEKLSIEVPREEEPEPEPESEPEAEDSEAPRPGAGDDEDDDGFDEPEEFDGEGFSRDKEEDDERERF